MASSKIPRKRTMMLGSALICLVLVPLVHAAVSRSAERDRRANEIATMTKSERNSLEYQFDEFQKLTPAEQQNYRDLHTELSLKENTDLRETLKRYQEFLRTLNPVDRAEIERQTGIAERLSAIQRVVNKLDKERQEQQQLLAESFENNQRYFRSQAYSKWRGEPLTSQEMEYMGSTLEDKLLPSDKLRVNLTNQTGNVRFALILAALIQQQRSSRPSDDRELLDAATLEVLLAGLNEDHREFFARFTEERQAMKQYTLIELATRGLFHQMQQEAPELDELQKYLQGMEPERKKDLMKNPTHRLYSELIKEYYKNNPTPLSDAMGKLWEIMRERDDVMRKLRGPNGPPRGPNGERDDNRPPRSGERGPDGPRRSGERDGNREGRSANDPGRPNPRENRPTEDQPQ